MLTQKTHKMTAGNHCFIYQVDVHLLRENTEWIKQKFYQRFKRVGFIFKKKKILFCFVLANYLGACPEMCLIHPARGVLIKFNLLQHCIKFRGYKCIKALLVYQICRRGWRGGSSVRALAALPAALGLVPSICYSSCRGSGALFWLPHTLHPCGTHTGRQK